MAVYTEVSDQALDEFLLNYDLGAVLSFKGIAEGTENSNYLLQTESGNHILTLYEKRVDEESLPFFLGLMDHLGAGGICCPTPVANRAGEALGRLAGRRAVVVCFLEGRALRRPLPRHCAQLGRVMAQMHLAGRDFPLVRRNALGMESWRGLLESCAPGSESVAAGLQDELLADLALLEKDWPSGLPEGAIHADLFPDNVFFIRDELSGVIDFYFSCTDSYAYDIAVCLNSWCFEPDGSFNVTAARALLSGYRECRKMTPEELAALPILCRGSALRFLLTRLYDSLNHVEGTLVTRKNPADYLLRLRFHRNVRGPSAYGVDN